MVVDNIKKKIGDNDYYLCMNEACPNAYFNKECNVIFNKAEVKEPIWFKCDANPKYVCYCSKVTKEQVLDAVVNKGAKNIKDIVKLTGAMKNSECEAKNPLGKCCSTIIQDTINEGLEMKGIKL